MLGIDTSAVSRGVRVLEEQLGVSLFGRSFRGTAPTSAGLIYLSGAREAFNILERAEAAARSVNEGRSGVLRIGFVWSFAFGPVVKLLHDFRCREPTIEVHILEDGPGALIARVHDRKLDVALTAIEPAGFAPTRPIGHLSRRTLWSERLLAAIPSSQRMERVSWIELAERKLLCRGVDDHRGFANFVERIGGPTLRFFPQDCSREGLFGLVAAGHGWTIVPESWAEFAIDGVKLTPIESVGAALSIQALWQSDNGNPALRAFIRLASKASRFKDLAHA